MDGMPCEKTTVRNGTQQIDMSLCMAVMFRWKNTGTSEAPDCTGIIQIASINELYEKLLLIIIVLLS